MEYLNIDFSQVVNKVNKVNKVEEQNENVCDNCKSSNILYELCNVVCKNCGYVEKNNFVEEQTDSIEHNTNVLGLTSFHTRIVGNTQGFHSIKKYNIWNNDKDKTLIRYYNLLNEMNHPLITKKIIKKTCMLYKDLFFDNGIIYRGKNRKSINGCLLYLIFVKCNIFIYKQDICDMFGITKTQLDNGLKKIYPYYKYKITEDYYLSNFDLHKNHILILKEIDRRMKILKLDREYVGNNYKGTLLWYLNKKLNFGLDNKTIYETYDIKRHNILFENNIEKYLSLIFIGFENYI
jgi:hypothetical protein